MIKRLNLLIFLCMVFSSVNFSPDVFALSNERENLSCSIEENGNFVDGKAIYLAYENQCGCLPSIYSNNVIVNSTDELNYAINNAEEFTNILLNDGTYSLKSLSSQLTINTPNLAIRSLSGLRGNVILDGEYKSGHSGFTINAENVTIADLTIKRIYYHPIHVSGGGHNIKLYNLHIIDGREQFVKVNPSYGLDMNDFGELACSKLELTNSGRSYIQSHPTPGFKCYTGGIDAHQAQGWVVRDNFFEGIYCTNGGLAEHAIHFWNNCRDTFVVRNRIKDCARGIGFGMGSTGKTRDWDDNPDVGVGYAGHLSGVIRNNVIHINPSVQPYYDSGITLEQAYKAKVFHNTLVSKPTWSSIDYRFSNTYAEIKNNLVYKITNRNGAFGNVSNNFEITADYDDYFVDYEDMNYNLKSTSSSNANVLDKGVKLSSAEIDLNGNYLGLSGIDIGAISFRNITENVSDEVDSIYVSINGDDNGDGSTDNPFRTLTKAVSVVKSGQTILIGSGQYTSSNYFVDLVGEADNPITIKGMDSNNKPIFTGGSEVMHFSDSRNFILKDLKIMGSSDNGINIDDGGEYKDINYNIVIDSLEFYDIGSTGNQDSLKISGINGVVIRNTYIHDGSTGGSGIDMVGCHNVTIENNYFKNLGTNSIQAKGGTSEILIRGNKFEDGGARAINMGGSTGLQYFRPLGADYEAKNIVVQSNVIIGSEAAVAYVGCIDCKVYNNLIYSPDKWVFRILQESVEGFLEVSNGEFFNNIIYFDNDEISTYVNIGPNTNSDSFILRNNVWAEIDGNSFTLDLPGTVLDNKYLDPEFENGFFSIDGLIFNLDDLVPMNDELYGAGFVVGLDRDLLGREYDIPPSIGPFSRNSMINHTFDGSSEDNDVGDNNQIIDLNGSSEGVLNSSQDDNLNESLNESIDDLAANETGEECDDCEVDDYYSPIDKIMIVADGSVGVGYSNLTLYVLDEDSKVIKNFDGKLFFNIEHSINGKWSRDNISKKASLLRSTYNFKDTGVKNFTKFFSFKVKGFYRFNVGYDCDDKNELDECTVSNYRTVVVSDYIDESIADVIIEEIITTNEAGEISGKNNTEEIIGKRKENIVSDNEYVTGSIILSEIQYDDFFYYIIEDSHRILIDNLGEIEFSVDPYKIEGDRIYFIFLKNDSVSFLTYKYKKDNSSKLYNLLTLNSRNQLNSSLIDGINGLSYVEKMPVGERIFYMIGNFLFSKVVNLLLILSFGILILVVVYYFFRRDKFKVKYITVLMGILLFSFCSFDVLADCKISCHVADDCIYSVKNPLIEYNCKNPGTCNASCMYIIPNDINNTERIVHANLDLNDNAINIQENVNRVDDGNITTLFGSMEIDSEIKDQYFFYVIKDPTGILTGNIDKVHFNIEPFRINDDAVMFLLDANEKVHLISYYIEPELSEKVIEETDIEDLGISEESYVQEVGMFDKVSIFFNPDALDSRIGKMMILFAVFISLMFICIIYYFYRRKQEGFDVKLLKK